MALTAARGSRARGSAAATPTPRADASGSPAHQRAVLLLPQPHLLLERRRVARPAARRLAALDARLVLSVALVQLLLQLAHEQLRRVQLLLQLLNLLQHCEAPRARGLGGEGGWALQACSRERVRKGAVHTRAEQGGALVRWPPGAGAIRHPPTVYPPAACVRPAAVCGPSECGGARWAGV
eukprot:995946-Prymnesium_polylepis.1